MHWYKRDPNAAIVGMACLSIAERGVYNSILDLIYASDGKLRDDDKANAHTLHIHHHAWRKHKAGLTAKGKIWVTHDGYLMAKRVVTTMYDAEKLSSTQRGKALVRWGVDSRKTNKINDAAMPPAMPLQPQPELHLEREGPRKEKRTAKAERKRGPRAPMPDDWRPSEVGERYAYAAGFAKDRIDRMTCKCRDYHIRNGTMIAGDRGLAATWRTWVDHEVDFDREKNGTPVDVEPDYKQITKGMTPEEKKAFVQEEMRKFREANHVG